MIGFLVVAGVIICLLIDGVRNGVRKIICGKHDSDLLAQKDKKGFFRCLLEAPWSLKLFIAFALVEVFVSLASLGDAPGKGVSLTIVIIWFFGKWIVEMLTKGDEVGRSCVCGLEILCICVIIFIVAMLEGELDMGAILGIMLHALNIILLFLPSTSRYMRSRREATQRETTPQEATTQEVAQRKTRQQETTQRETTQENAFVVDMQSAGGAKPDIPSCDVNHGGFDQERAVENEGTPPTIAPGVLGNVELIIDGNNVVRHSSRHGWHVLKTMLDCIKAKGIGYFLYFDASVSYLEMDTAGKMFIEKQIADIDHTTKCPSRDEADKFILYRADKTGGHVISNDGYKPWELKYSWIDARNNTEDIRRVHKFTVEGNMLSVPDLDIFERIAGA